MERFNLSIEDILQLIETSEVFSSPRRKAVGILISLYSREVIHTNEFDKEKLRDFLINNLPSEFGDILTDMEIYTEEPTKDGVLNGRILFSDVDVKGEEKVICIDFVISPSISFS